jgi:hypothetical protein
MKCFWGSIYIFLALLFPVIAADESVKEREANCESVSYNENLYIPVAEIHERLKSLSWPELSSFAKFGRIVGNAVFQIKVSTSGEICSIEPIGGQSIVLAMLAPEIKKWKFHPDKPFWGIIAIRYTTNEGFRLL